MGQIADERRAQTGKIPGLVDLQVNGYKGVDFSGGDLTAADFARACRQLLAGGTTAFLPTLITSPADIYERNLPLIAETVDKDEFRGRVLGIHLEGPFISRQDGARGAHTAEWVRNPDPGYLDELIHLANGKVRLLTIAADQEGAVELSRHATSRGIAVSLGHHMATDQDMDRLVQAGAKALTHLGNAVPAMLERHRNPIWAGLANDSLWATLITDGHHLPPALIKTILRVKGPQRCIVVSDASPLAGMPPGRYKSMGANVVLEENGRLYNPATGYLAGSSATMPQCVDYLRDLGLLDPDDLVRVCFSNPLALIGCTPEDVVLG
ncbi:MAG: N-acetylglucosamine-6-phosphate deacetylase [Phycisphaerales bacterium]